MRRTWLHGLTALASASALTLFTSLATAPSLSGCGESASCTRLRQQTYATMLAWGACDPNDPLACILVPGNPRDCTGVLSCDFAVARQNRIAAQQAVLTIAQQSQGCYLCATPDCPQGNIAYCEPVSQQCIVISELLDGGAIDIATGPPVEGGPEEIDDTGAPTDAAEDTQTTPINPETTTPAPTQ